MLKTPKYGVLIFLLSIVTLFVWISMALPEVMLVDRLPVKQYIPWIVIVVGSEVIAVQSIVSDLAETLTDKRNTNEINCIRYFMILSSNYKSRLLLLVVVATNRSTTGKGCGNIESKVIEIFTSTNGK